MKRPIKYIGPIIMSTIIGIAVLGGCNSLNESYRKNISSDEQVEKISIYWWGNQTRNQRTQKVLDMYSEINENIECEGRPSAVSDYYDKLTVAAAGHTLPDIIQMDYKYLKRYATKDLLVDLSPYIKAGILNLEDADKNIIESGSIDGKVYAVCSGINAPALLYNKTLLEENGIQIKDYMSIDEFIELSREVYKKTGYKTNIAYNAEEEYLEYLLRDSGYVLYKGEDLGISSGEPVEKFFSLYERGINEDWLINPEVFAERTFGMLEQDPLIMGDKPESLSWCFFGFSNQLTAMQAAAPEGVEIGITTWPADHPQKANYLKPGQFWAITTDCQNVEEAVKVIDYLINDVECNKVLLSERGMPPSDKVVQSISGYLDDTSQLAIQYLKQVVKPKSSKINPSPHQKANEVIVKLYGLVGQVCYQKLSVQEAANLFYKEAKVLLSNE